METPNQVEELMFQTRGNCVGAEPGAAVMYCHHSTVKSPVPTAKSEEPATDKYLPEVPNCALPVVYAAFAVGAITISTEKVDKAKVTAKNK
jgi:hypothetical protein